MKKSIIAFLLFICITGFPQTKSTLEKLGYPANTKLLIIHADDMGVSHAQNEASIKAMEKGSVNSGSIMVPCPWFPEIAAYAKDHPTADLGLHLTLTAEWKFYKWGSVISRSEGQSLVDQKGYMPDNVGDFIKNAKIAEVEKELRAQVERAKQFGVDPTHFDTHMGSMFATADYAKLYIKLSHDYKVPVLLHHGMAKALGMDLKDHINEKDVVADNIHMAGPDDFKGGMKNFYTKVIRSMPPGLNVLLLHAAYDNAEMQAVTIDHPDYGAAWRQADFDFFSSEECKKLLKEEKIQLVTWRELRDKIVRK